MVERTVFPDAEKCDQPGGFVPRLLRLGAVDSPSITASPSQHQTELANSGETVGTLRQSKWLAVSKPGSPRMVEHGRGSSMRPPRVVGSSIGWGPRDRPSYLVQGLSNSFSAGTGSALGSTLGGAGSGVGSAGSGAA